MPSHSDGPENMGNAGNRPGGNDLPRELDPRRGRPQRPDTSRNPGRTAGGRSESVLPPEFDPRGRRHARQAASAAAAAAAPSASPGDGRPTRSQRRAAERRGTDLRAGVSIGVQILAAALSLCVLIGSGWAWATYRNFSQNIHRVNAINGDTAAAQRNIDGSDQNILIVGNDDRDSATDAELAALGTTRDGGSYNTDTMMMLHVPADGSKATVISFPRDSYVAIPGHGQHKLNSAYVDGVLDSHGDKGKGAQLLVQTIENLTGLKVDHFVQVDLLGFYRISNAIGGVTVCLNGNMGPATSVGQEGNGFDSGYEPNGTFVKSYSGINLHKGLNVIQGTQALAFVRQRHGLPNGDLDRIKRQQYFLSAVFRKISSAGTLLNPFKLQDLLKAVTASLQMDETLNPLKLAQQMQNLQAGNVRFTTIPTSGFQDTPSDGNVVVVDMQAMPDFINSLIGNGAADTLAKATAADPSTVTVAVVNDTNSNGAETTNAAALQKAGFKTTIPAATSDTIAQTTIEYPSGQESAAKALQAQVPNAVMRRTSEVQGVTLLLGNNGVQVKSLMQTSAGAGSASATGSSGGSGSSAAASGSGGVSSSAASSGGAGSTGSTGSTAASSNAPQVTTAAQAGCIN